MKTGWLINMAVGMVQKYHAIILKNCVMNEMTGNLIVLLKSLWLITLNPWPAEPGLILF